MQTAPPARILACADTALTIEFGEAVDRHVSALVLALADRMDRQAIAGVVELVPTFRSLMVHYDPILLPQAELKRRLVPLLAGLEAAQEAGRRWRIPACYHESLAPDLNEVAERTGLTPANVVERHSATTFHVYMVGFLPGYPYMGDLPPELVLPRRENPRTAVPPGSLAIATTQTIVYTLESPGGWHLIGRTPAPLWDARQARPAILAAGDKVVFEPVSVTDYESMLARAASGEFRLRPEAA
jgi:KipI family sensor histidine kinase inhibitor